MTTNAALKADQRRGDYMPLRLKQILLDHNLKQIDLCNAVRQSHGAPLSKAAAGLLCNYNTWPASTSSESIVKQTRDFLIANGIPEAVADTAFVLDDQAAVAGKPPLGRPFAVVDANYKLPASKTKADETNDEDNEPEVVMLSPAARKKFALMVNPFNNEVNGPDDLYLGADQRYVREVMYQAARRAGDLQAVIGESGSGKTTLRRDLIERIQREALQCVVIQPRTLDKQTLNARNLLVAILGDLRPGEPPRQTQEALARQVEAALLASGKAGHTHLLVIEEAHDLTITVLKLLKRLWEIEDGFRKLLSIVLIGQPELKDKLSEQRYPEAREFIRRCEQVQLLPLDADCGEYLALKFGRSNGRKLADIFDADAVDAIRMRLTRDRKGVYPLLVNNLAVRALNLAAEMGVDRITNDIVMEA